MPPVDEVVSPTSLRAWALPHPRGDKASRGRLLVVGGSRSTPGAAMLAGLAALRVGAGVLTLAVASSVAGAVAVAVPEAGVVGLPEDLPDCDGEPRSDPLRSALERPLSSADAVLVGPGLDDVDVAGKLVTAVTSMVGGDVPIVLDAYALGALASLPDDTRKALADRLVITPNQKEVQVLLSGPCDDDAESAGADELRALAERYGAVVSSSNLVVSPRGRVADVPAGHPGLGTSGSGDVLAGALTGLLARGASLDQAACWATYLHAAAGDRLAARVGALGFLARELLDELPLVLSELQA
jgi:ADP-dependent NAD(P)H-hydrate dehydratase